MQTDVSSIETTNTPDQRSRIHLLLHYLACIGGLIVAIMNGALSYHYIALAIPQISTQARLAIAFASFLCNALTFTLGVAKNLSQLRASSLFGIDPQKPFKWSFKSICVSIFTFISNVGFTFCLFTLGQDAWAQIMDSYGITSANSIYATYACSIGFSMSNFVTFMFSKDASNTQNDTAKRKNPFVKELFVKFIYMDGIINHKSSLFRLLFVHFVSIVQSCTIVVTVGLTSLPVLYTIMPILPAQVLAAVVGTSLWNINRLFYAENLYHCIDAFYDNGPNGHNKRFSKNKLLSILLFCLTVLNAAGNAATAPVKRISMVALRYLLLGNGFFASSLLNLNTMRKFMGDKDSWPESKSESIRLVASLGLTAAISVALLIPGFAFSPIAISLLLYAALTITLSTFYRMDTPPAASAAVTRMLYRKPTPAGKTFHDAKQTRSATTPVNFSTLSMMSRVAKSESKAPDTKLDNGDLTAGVTQTVSDQSYGT